MAKNNLLFNYIIFNLYFVTAMNHSQFKG